MPDQAPQLPHEPLLHVFDWLWVSETHATSPTGWLASYRVRSWLVVPSCAVLGLVHPGVQEVIVCGLAGLHAVQPSHEPDEHVFDLL